MMTDPIADMLVRINNACAMRHETVEVPSSKTKTAILNVLKNDVIFQFTHYVFLFPYLPNFRPLN